jgi:uncharacterized protein (DUF2252 family)
VIYRRRAKGRRCSRGRATSRWLSQRIGMRGSTLSFYDWLSDLKPGAIPDGPAIWICGDCHVGNLGPVASPNGAIDIQIRDLDQTVIGDPAHDLLRLALSLASAARASNLPCVTTALMPKR